MGTYARFVCVSFFVPTSSFHGFQVCSSGRAVRAVHVVDRIDLGETLIKHYIQGRDSVYSECSRLGFARTEMNDRIVDFLLHVILYIIKNI